MAICVYTLEPVWFESNCYLVTADGKTAVAIDTAKPNLLELAKRDWGLTVTHVLLTHGHYDHLSGCAALQAQGAKIGCLDREQDLVLGKDNLAKEVGYPLDPFTVDFTFQDDETLLLNGMEIKVIATPGHTAGSCCFLMEPNRMKGHPAGMLFTGDTLFYHDIGRTDLPTGNEKELIKSLAKLCALKGNYNIFPGHGEQSTLEDERKNNPYLKSC